MDFSKEIIEINEIIAANGTANLNIVYSDRNGSHEAIVNVNEVCPAGLEVTHATDTEDFIHFGFIESITILDEVPEAIEEDKDAEAPTALLSSLRREEDRILEDISWTRRQVIEAQAQGNDEVATKMAVSLKALKAKLAKVLEDIEGEERSMDNTEAPNGYVVKRDSDKAVISEVFATRSEANNELSRIAQSGEEEGWMYIWEAEAPAESEEEEETMTTLIRITVAADDFDDNNTEVISDIVEGHASSEPCDNCGRRSEVLAFEDPMVEPETGPSHICLRCLDSFADYEVIEADED